MTGIWSLCTSLLKLETVEDGSEAMWNMPEKHIGRGSLVKI